MGEEHWLRIEDLPVPAYLCDGEGRLIRWNDAARELWGRRPEPGEFPAAIPGAVIAIGAIGAINESVPGTLHLVTDASRRRLQTDFPESEEIMRSIVESSPDCLKLLGLDGRLLTMNVKGCEAMDVDDFSSECRGRFLLELWPEEGRGAIEDAIRRARHGESMRFEGRCPTLKGVEKWWDVTVTAVLDASGKPARIVVISRDITHRHHAEAMLRESNERFSSAFAEAPIGLVLLTSDGKILEANPAFQQMVGYTDEELRGANSAPITLPDDVLSTRDFFASFRQPGAPCTIEKRYIHKDGRIVWGRASVTVRRDYAGNVIHLTAIVEDITARKEVERERDRLVQELRRSNEELSTFAQIAAHDLRSPLRMVRSYTALLELRLKAALDESSREYMAYVRDGAERMEHLVEGLLKFAQAGSEPPEFVPLPMDRIVASAIADLEPFIAEAQARVVHDRLPVAYGDEMQLQQLFQNLISNAIKYRRPNVDPLIRVAAEHDGGFWKCSVADNGQGIAPEYFKHIFKPLKRLHGVEVQGTGLGLAICQKIVERHGGRIWLESLVGEGSTFYFILPGVPG